MVGPAPVGATPRASAVTGVERNGRRPIRGHGTIPALLTCTYRECLGCRPGSGRTRGNSVGSTGRRPGVRGVAHAYQGTHGPQLRAAGPPPQHEHLHAAPVLRGGHRPPRLRARRALRRALRGDGGGAAGTAPAVAVGGGGTAADTDAWGTAGERGPVRRRRRNRPSRPNLPARSEPATSADPANRSSRPSPSSRPTRRARRVGRVCPTGRRRAKPAAAAGRHAVGPRTVHPRPHPTGVLSAPPPPRRPWHRRRRTLVGAAVAAVLLAMLGSPRRPAVRPSPGGRRRPGR